MRFELFPKNNIRYFHFKYLMDAFSGVKGSVLDIGCGWGVVSVQLKKLKNKLDVIGLDNNSEYIFLCKKKYKDIGIKWICGDVQRLPFKKKTFDAASMLDVLEHVKNPNRAISEISRVLKSGGTFYLAVPLEADLTTIDGWVKKIFGKNYKKKPIGHINQFTEKNVKSILALHGFKIRKIRYTYHFIFQTLSFIYYLYVAKARKGKYLPLASEKPIFGKLLSELLKLGGYCVYLENRLFVNFKGQTAHIEANLFAEKS